MKSKRILIFAFVAVLSVFSCQKEAENVAPTESLTNDNSLVREGFLTSRTDYKTLDAKQKVVADLLNSAVAGLEALNANSEHIDYEAIIILSNNQNDKFSNFVTLAKRDNSSFANARIAAGCSGSCDVSGFGSTVSCVKAIRDAVDSCGDLDLSVSKNKDGSYHVSWKKTEK